MAKVGHSEKTVISGKYGCLFCERTTSSKLLEFSTSYVVQFLREIAVRMKDENIPREREREGERQRQREGFCGVGVPC